MIFCSECQSDGNSNKCRSRFGACQLYYLGGHAPLCGQIIGILKLKDGMPTDLAGSLKADEEDRKTDHAPGVAVWKENDITVWDPGLFDPARCAHLLGVEN